MKVAPIDVDQSAADYQAYAATQAEEVAMFRQLMFTVIAVSAVAVTSAPVYADDTHHPPEAGSQAAPAPAPQGAQNMPGRQGMMGGGQGMMGSGQGMMGGGQGVMGQGGAMGGQGMPGGMMGMMRMMMGQGGAMAGMTDHVEGRIAFLRTELKIAANQSEAWNQFAGALRSNAKKLREARGAGTISGATSLEQRFDQQEKLLAVQLEGLRGMKAAYDRLAGVLSDEQKQIAEELIPPQIGMMPGFMM